jgi:methionyl aminopeptidase
MVLLKSPEQIKKLEYINRLGVELLEECYEYIRPGTHTIVLEELTIKFCEKYNVKSAFLNYRKYPHYLCVSVNEEIIHGFPGSYEIKTGDIVSVDAGFIRDGFVSDAAFTKIAGKAPKAYKKLVATTREALYESIDKAIPSNRISDISSTIYAVALRMGFDVIRDFVGHGVGFSLHEEPKIPNYVKKDDVRLLIKPGMVLAIEPMLVEGSYEYKVKPNGWTVVTADKKMAAHFEHSVAVLNDGPLILSQSSLW